MKYQPFIQKIFSTYLAIVTTILLFAGCNRDSDQLSTELRIMITNNSVPQSGATVKLYRTQTDMETRIRPVDSAVTNSTGVVVFKKLQSVQYFVHASYNDGTLYYDNSTAQFNLLDDLIDGAITVATIPIINTRPSVPTSMIVNSVQVIRFDTTNWDRYQSKSCSENLYMSLVGIRNNNKLDTLATTDKSRPFQFCFYQGLALNIPDVPLVSPLGSSPHILLNKYAGLYVDFFSVNSTDTIKIDLSQISANISTPLISNFINGSRLVGEAYPARIRVYEAEVKSPPAIKYAKFIVDLRVSWE